MMGSVLQVSPPRDYEFNQITSGQAQTQTVMERIDVGGADKIDLVVRVHETATISTSGNISVQLVADGFTADDPSQDFFSGVIGGQAQVIFGAGAVAAGTLQVATVSADVGSRVAVQVVGVGGSGDVALRLSIDLVLKHC